MKLPYIDLFTADWIKDTRCLSLEARGAWIDCLCYLQDADPRGKLRLELARWAKMLNTTESETKRLFDELSVTVTANITTHVDGSVTVVSRRMMRETVKRKLAAVRQKRLRLRKSDATVTPESHGSNGDVTTTVTDTRARAIGIGIGILNTSSLPGGSPEGGASDGAVKARMDALAAAICPLFGRTDPRFTLGEEEHLAFDLASNGFHEADIGTFSRWWASQTGEDAAKRPQSVMAVLRGWQQHMDRARIWALANRPAKKAGDASMARDNLLSDLVNALWDARDNDDSFNRILDAAKDKYRDQPRNADGQTLVAEALDVISFRRSREKQPQ